MQYEQRGGNEAIGSGRRVEALAGRMLILCNGQAPGGNGAIGG